MELAVSPIRSGRLLVVSAALMQWWRLWLLVPAIVVFSFALQRSTAAGLTTERSAGLGPVTWGLTPGPDGALWLAGSDEGNGVIERIAVPSAQTSLFRVPCGTWWATPWGITTGPDGALWFTCSGRNSQSIGRLTTSGSLRLYRRKGINDPVAITTGPDKALWFLNYGNNSVGRITTSGTLTIFHNRSIDHPSRITTGPDGALWFTVQEEGFSGHGAIARLTTRGEFRFYRSPAVYLPGAITVGPDKAMWFTNTGGNLIGRITTRGVIRTYPVGGVKRARALTVGPDGAIWFTVPDSPPEQPDAGIGRITTAGTVHLYRSASIISPTEMAARLGALWFEDVCGISRITMTGVVTAFNKC